MRFSTPRLACMSSSKPKPSCASFQVKGFWDYSSEEPGAAAGRGLMPEPCDASILGPLRPKLRPPLRVATLLGMMVELPEQATFMKAGRSLSAALFVARRLARHAVAVLRHGDITRLANGAALIARLLKASVDNGVELHRLAGHRAHSSARRRGRGRGRDDARRGDEIYARRGVVVATGGFNHDRKRRDALVPWAAGVPKPGMSSLARTAATAFAWQRKWAVSSALMWQAVSHWLL